MMKKMMVLVGMAAMLLCGCGRTETVEVKTECEAVVERAIETSEEMVEELTAEVTDMYIEAVYEVFGDDIDINDVTCNNSVVSYDDKSVSWEYLDEIAYNSMTNEYWS